MFSKISDRLVGRRIAAWCRPINPPSIRILNPSHRCQNQSQIISHNASAPSFPNCPHLSCPMANFIGSLSFACHTFCGPWTRRCNLPLVINQQASQQPSVEKCLRRFPSFAPSPSTLSRDTWSVCGSLWAREWPNVLFVFYVILCFSKKFPLFLFQCHCPCFVCFCVFVYLSSIAVFTLLVLPSLCFLCFCVFFFFPQ